MIAASLALLPGSAAFELPGGVATQRMFGDPASQAGMGDLMKHFDEDKLEAVLLGE